MKSNFRALLPPLSLELSALPVFLNKLIIKMLTNHSFNMLSLGGLGGGFLVGFGGNVDIISKSRERNTVIETRS
jgi:hypothetical protein